MRPARGQASRPPLVSFDLCLSHTGYVLKRIPLG